MHRPPRSSEPIPGYVVQERIGVGGYGEVWSAQAPGGLVKAIKFVYGYFDDARASRELKALDRIKQVRHPFLLSLERFEIVDGQLVIVTELADMSLLDRYQSCRKKGQRGIARAELLVYLRDAAEALDYMSAQFGLQHLDIKPQNLLLVGGRIKVADFGLVKRLQGSSATATGGVTPLYAPPEAFDGRVSKHSDQYSLAIVYQEMLTGVRPFPGTTLLQLARQHTQSPPLLDSLPLEDRRVIARALSKAPEQRFESCSELIRQLLTATPQPGAETPGAKPGARPPSPDHPSGTTTTAGTCPIEPVDAVRPVRPRSSAEITPRPQSTYVAPRVASSAPGDERGARPALFLGVGGLAWDTLRKLRRRLYDRFGSATAMPIYRFLLLDTDRQTIREAQTANHEEALDNLEALLTPLRKPDHYRPQARDLLRWLDRRWLYGIPRSLQTEGMRPLGRLAFLDNANEILTRLRIVLGEMSSAEALETAVAATGMGLREEAPQIFLITSLTGGTGGGMIVDLAYAVRQVLRELGLPDHAVTGLLLYGTGQQPAGQKLAQVNAWAALTELHHFSLAESHYDGDPRCGLQACAPGTPPLADSYLVHLGDNLTESTERAATDNVAEFLYLQAVSPSAAELCLGRRADSAPAYEDSTGLCVRTFGMARITMPRYRLARLAGDLFCQYLVNRWRGELGVSPEEQQRVQKRMQKWAKLSPEQRRAAREQYKSIVKLPPEKKQDLRQQWAEYQALSPHEKRMLDAPAVEKRPAERKRRAKPQTMPPLP